MIPAPGPHRWGPQGHCTGTPFGRNVSPFVFHWLCSISWGALGVCTTVSQLSPNCHPTVTSTVSQLSPWIYMVSAATIKKEELHVSFFLKLNTKTMYIHGDSWETVEVTVGWQLGDSWETVVKAPKKPASWSCIVNGKPMEIHVFTMRPNENQREIKGKQLESIESNANQRKSMNINTNQWKSMTNA